MGSALDMLLPVVVAEAAIMLAGIVAYDGQIRSCKVRVMPWGMMCFGVSIRYHSRRMTDVQRAAKPATAWIGSLIRSKMLAK